MDASDCENLSGGPFYAMIVFIVVMHLATFVCACYRVKWVFRVYWAFMLILILLVSGFNFIGLVVIDEGDAHVISGRGYEEYRLQDFSKWLQKRVEKSSNWNNIRSCIQSSNVCNQLGVDSGNVVDKEFFKKDLSPIESGCCKPPTSCNFGYVNATYWIPTAGNFSDMDCNRWNTEEDQLCYNCDSCKAGALTNVRDNWSFGCFVVTMFAFLCCVAACIVFSDKDIKMAIEGKSYSRIVPSDAAV